MEHVSTENLSKEELAFNEMMQRGEDFMKIEIFRSARECFSNALAMNFNNPLAQEKLSLCNQNIKSESKIIINILIVFAVVIAAVTTYLFW
jgi:hypothetical protein